MKKEEEKRGLYLEHTNKNTLVIIDSMFIAHWSSYPIESRQYNGVPTTVIYSMVKSLIDIKKEFPVDSHFLFTWDSSSYFRKEFFPGYKLRGYDKDEAIEKVYAHVSAILDGLHSKETILFLDEDN